ncbi:MAG: DNA-binding transcriptional regulator Fis [Gammaproteobacteria bacterium]|nr:DNA-binding transcriptional regulator Fis [Gammaproteobacteria bacterium]
MSDQNFQDSGQNNSDSESDSQEISQLSHAVKHSIRRYLYELEGTQPNNMYEMVLRQIEQPLFEAILEHTKGNQSRAAEVLGLNRGTLRKKLRSYNLHK